MIAAGGLLYYARTDAVSAQILPPFPGERIRVHLALPDTALIDQQAAPFRFADLRGRVVLVTGVYAACTTAPIGAFTVSVQASVVEPHPSVETSTWPVKLFNTDRLADAGPANAMPSKAPVATSE